MTPTYEVLVDDLLDYHARVTQTLCTPSAVAVQINVGIALVERLEVIAAALTELVAIKLEGKPTTASPYRSSPTYRNIPKGAAQ